MFTIRFFSGNFEAPVQNVSLTSTPIDSSPVKVIAGKQQSFTCVAMSFSKPLPTAMYQWYLGNTNITSAGDGGGIYVTFNKSDNGSKLKCKSWNHATKSPFPEIVKTIDILCKYYNFYVITVFSEHNCSIFFLRGKFLLHRNNYCT